MGVHQAEEVVVVEDGEDGPDGDQDQGFNRVHHLHIPKTRIAMYLVVLRDRCRGQAFGRV